MNVAKIITWKETLERLKKDKSRILDGYDDTNPYKPVFLIFNPSYQSVLLHRISHYFFVNNHRILARLFWHLNLLITGADISPISDLGGGLLIISPLNVTIVGKIGENFTILSHGGLGGGLSTRDIGAGPGLPVVGDNVTIGFGGIILGSIEVRDGITTGVRTLITKDIKEKSTIQLIQPTTENESYDVNKLDEYKSEYIGFWELIDQDILQYIKYSSDFSNSKVSLLKKISVFFTPSLMCNVLYRLSHMLYFYNLKLLARLVTKINYLLHRIYISPASSIGGGLYIPHTPGIIFHANAGSNLVLYARSIVCSHDFHPDQSKMYNDCPQLGNDVLVGTYSVVAGEITVGNNVSIGVNVYLNKTVGDNMNVFSKDRSQVKD